MSEASRQRLLDVAEVYALHAVDSVETAEIEQHLASVDDTARVQFNILVSEIQETLALMSVFDAVDAPAEMKARVLQELPGVAQATPMPSTPMPSTASNVSSMSLHRDRKSNRWRSAMMAAAAAVVVLVGGGVVATQVIGNDPTPTQAEQIAAAPDIEEVTADFPGGGTATVSYSRGSDSALVKLDGVATPAAGKDYQMWFVDGTPRSVGLVTAEQLAGGDGTVIGGMGAATNFAFSLEPTGGSPQPTEVLTMVTLAA
ncbi:anti-sigma factor [Rhodococcus sp. G-MC3]|uniref:anti-sigma factor n=1 Tax=Rhodococcus sp. G-MC3 TaxID=3046209 RepID=UPI0024BA4CB6|nr:anti-sigma factor [Rhodococcus sp. G-MC3]MDJ0391715.1 anti-sigma factor [Rhodococcus sp. G-MC3]